MRPFLRRLSLLALLLAGRPARADQPAASLEINKPFQNPNAEEFVKRFETESRAVYNQRRAIVEALGLKPGMAVAGIGAGTGLFTRLIAERVGKKGKVYAVDIAPAFLKHIDEESKRLGQTQVATVRGTQTTTRLGPATIDLAFLCDTYHHIEHPATVLESIHSALRPGGQLVVIDFDRVEGHSSVFILKHVRASRKVFAAEIEAAGFEPIASPDAPKIRENFFLRFRRKANPAPPKVGLRSVGRHDG